MDDQNEQKKSGKRGVVVKVMWGLQDELESHMNKERRLEERMQKLYDARDGANQEKQEWLESKIADLIVERAEHTRMVYSLDKDIEVKKQEIAEIAKIIDRCYDEYVWLCTRGRKSRETKVGREEEEEAQNMLLEYGGEEALDVAENMVRRSKKS